MPFYKRDLSFGRKAKIATFDETVEAKAKPKRESQVVLDPASRRRAPAEGASARSASSA